MRTLVLIVGAGVAAVLASHGTTAVRCRIVPPVTLSPTGSRLWTVDLRGSWVAAPQYVNADGSMWLKAPWWAAGPRSRPRRGPRGELTITGRRLDEAAPPLRARTRQVGVEGFGGSGVWAVVLTFPTEGCWSVTGRVERTTHTFRLLVTKVE